MEKIDRELLIKEISTRLPYGIKVQVFGWDEEKGEVAVPLKVYSINMDGYITLEYNHYDVESVYIEDCLLYLRPMSSMTEEEIHEFQEILGPDIETGYGFVDILDSSVHTFSFLELQALFDWLNKKMFDYRGLIPKGLALEAPEEMYKVEEQ